MNRIYLFFWATSNQLSLQLENIEVIDFSDKDLDSLDILSLFGNYSHDEIVFIYLGKQDYNPMWKFQKVIHNEVKNNNAAEEYYLTDIFALAEKDGLPAKIIKSDF